MGHISRSRHAALSILVLVLAAVLAACGGSDGDAEGGDGTQTAEASAGLDTQKIDAILSDAYSKGKWEGPSEAAPAPEGKKVAFIPTFAAAEGLVLLEEGVKAAAKALNYELIVIDGEGTPQGYAAAISQAITQNVDAVILGAIDPNLVLEQMRQMKAAGIDVVAQSNVSEPTDDLWIANVGYQTEKEGEYLAAFVAQDSEGEANLLYVETPEFGVVRERSQYFKPTLEELCPACDIAVESEFQVTELETKLGPKIGAELQANPDVDYILAPYDASVPPMITAIKQAGRDGEVSIASYGGFKQATDYLRNEEIQKATVANAVQWEGWQTFDTLIRYWNDLPIDDTVLHSAPIKLLTWENAPPPGTYFEGDADYESEYEELWGVK